MTDNYYSFVNFGLGLFTNFFNLFEIPKNFLLYQNLFRPIDQFFRLATGQLPLVVNFFWSILKSPFVFGTSSSLVDVLLLCHIFKSEQLLFFFFFGSHVIHFVIHKFYDVSGKQNHRKLFCPRVIVVCVLNLCQGQSYQPIWI